MPEAYPSSLTTEHVKSHLQKLRVKAKTNRDKQLADCDALLAQEYNLDTGDYIQEPGLTNAMYEKIASRFGIAYEMLKEPERFANEMSGAFKEGTATAGKASSVPSAKKSEQSNATANKDTTPQHLRSDNGTDGSHQNKRHKNLI